MALVIFEFPPLEALGEFSCLGSYDLKTKAFDVSFALELYL
jgi:hypothetical protein